MRLNGQAARSRAALCACYAGLCYLEEGILTASRIVSIAAVLFIFVSGSAQAGWTSSVRSDGKGAGATVKAQGKTLRLSCAQFMGSDLSLTLHGGPFEGMKNVDDGDDSMMMWIEMPDGRTARHPIDGHYYGHEDAFVGRFPVSDIVLEQFAGGREMRFTTIKGNTLLSVPTTGTSKAREDFRRGCGL